MYKGKGVRDRTFYGTTDPKPNFDAANMLKPNVGAADLQMSGTVDIDQPKPNKVAANLSNPLPSLPAAVVEQREPITKVTEMDRKMFMTAAKLTCWTNDVVLQLEELRLVLMELPTHSPSSYSLLCKLRALCKDDVLPRARSEFLDNRLDGKPHFSIPASDRDVHRKRGFINEFLQLAQEDTTVMYHPWGGEDTGVLSLKSHEYKMIMDNRQRDGEITTFDAIRAGYIWDEDKTEDSKKELSEEEIQAMLATMRQVNPYYKNTNEHHLVGDMAVLRGNASIPVSGSIWSEHAEKLAKAREDVRNGSLQVPKGGSMYDLIPEFNDSDPNLNALVTSELTNNAYTTGRSKFEKRLTESFSRGRSDAGESSRKRRRI